MKSRNWPFLSDAILSIMISYFPVYRIISQYHLEKYDISIFLLTKNFLQADNENKYLNME